MDQYINTFLFNAKWLLIVAAIFIPLSYVFARKRQPSFHKGLLIDGFYWLAGPLLYSCILFPIIIAFYSGIQAIVSLHYWGVAHFSPLPILLQAVIILLISDVIQYWLHRFFHRDPLWKFHAIHHSSQVVDWLSAARFHPINIIFYSLSVNALVACMGFSAETFQILIPFNMIYSPLVHANVPWTYGPFKYIMASPVFHRWHHTHLHEGGNKNFAPTFSFLDVIFGTFYMPKDRLPENFGIEGNPVPNSVLGQMIYPFKKNPKAE